MPCRQHPARAPARLRGMGGTAVDAYVTPGQDVGSVGGGRTLRLMLVWGVRFTAECLAEILGRNPSVSIVGLCFDLSEAVALGTALQADIVLLDARIQDGTLALRRALDLAPGMRVVVSAVRETEEDIVAWAEAGVIGYIPRTTPLGDFVRLIMEIHSGEQNCSGRIAAGLLRRIANGARPSHGRNAALVLPALTRRERQTAELIKSGLSDKEIARRLNISVATTKSHVHNLLGKLHLRRRSEVADYLRDPAPARSTLVVSLLILATALAPVRWQRERAEHAPPRIAAPQRATSPTLAQSRRRAKLELTVHARHPVTGPFFTEPPGARAISLGMPHRPLRQTFL